MRLCWWPSAGLGLGLLACWLGAGAVLPDGVPTLDEMSGDRMGATLLRDTPAISNWAGSVGTNVDVVDATSFIVPPLAGAPSMLRLRVDGKDLKLDSVRWSAYEAERRSFPLIVGAHAITVTSQLRMAFNSSALLWKISLASTTLEGVPPDAISYDDIIHTLEFSVQAIARQFDEMGWLLMQPPRSPRFWSTKLLAPTETGGRAMVLHRDRKSDAASGFVFADHQPSAWAWVADPQQRNRSAAVGLVNLFLAPGETASLRVVAAMGPSKALGGMKGMARRLNDYAARFEEHFDAAKSEWERVWAEAFTPPAARPMGQPQLFSGHLPTLHTADEAIRRLYYMGALTLLATGRTSTSAFNDDGSTSAQSTYITGFGNTCWTRGDLRPSEVDCLKPASPRDTVLEPIYIGATAQFYWDTSLRALLTSLLDPAALRRYIVKLMSLPGCSFERSFGLDALNGAPIGYEYVFNAHSIFTIVSTYLRATNDSSLLSHVVDEGTTLEQRLELVALDWVHRRLPKPGVAGRDDGDGVGDQPVGGFALWPWSGARNKKGAFRRKSNRESGATATAAASEDRGEDPFLFLADYGGDINAFLECVPSYLHATPALQAGNAEMMAWMGTLRAAQGNATGAHRFRGWARAIAADTVEHLYVRGGEGVWGCLYPDYSLTPVRHVLDFLYVTRGLAAVAAYAPSEDGAGPLPARIGGRMSFFFHDELETPTWLRALSPYDRLNLRVPRPKSILRPDHGITGAFDAWAALAAEALAILDREWEGALAVLRHMAAVTREGPFGQAHEIDDMDLSAFKTKRSFTRYTADNGVSFSDVLVRGLFGYDPPFLAQHDPSLPFHGLEAAFDGRGRAGPGKDAPRGDLQARLENLATPWGMATLEVGSDGVRIVELVEVADARTGGGVGDRPSQRMRRR